MNEKLFYHNCSQEPQWASRGFFYHMQNISLFSMTFIEKVLKVVKSPGYCISLKKEGQYSDLILVLWLNEGTREISRLDLTMQSLIQDILSQIIDSSPCCPERFRDFSCMRFPFKTKQKVLSHVNSFWSEIYKKCQKWFWVFEAYLEWNFCNL